MALPLAVWYAGSTKWNAVAAWAVSVVYAAGAIVRQAAAPAINSERVFVCVVAGTSSGTEPTWVITKGAKTTDNTVTWQEVTGRSAVNGDLTNTVKWSGGVASTAIALGYIIQDTVADTYFICTTAGTAGSSEPTWSKTAGATTTDGGVTWTSLGAVGNFPAWGASHARLSGGIPWLAAGETLYVSNNHAETQASVLSTPAGSGTVPLPIKIICVNDATAPATATATTASVSCTGANNINISPTINVYMYGINFLSGSAANATTFLIGQINQFFENCNFTLNNSNAGSYFYWNQSNPGYDPAANVFKNCTFVFGASAQSFFGNNTFGASFIGGSIAATGVAPSSLFFGAAYFGKMWFLLLRDVDLSGITGTLFDASGSNAINYGYALVENCKLGAGVTMFVLGAGAAISPYGPYTKIYASDSAATTYRYYFGNSLGVAQNESTVVRSGGASDGTTTQSWNVTTNTLTTYFTPFITDDIFAWNNASGAAKTATVYLTSNAALNNNDIWLEIEYLKNSGNPQGGNATGKMALLGTVTAISTDTSTWGGSTTYKYKLSVPFTPLLKGVVKGRVYVAKPSVTVYIDPVLIIV